MLRCDKRERKCYLHYAGALALAIDWVFEIVLVSLFLRRKYCFLGKILQMVYVLIFIFVLVFS